MLTCSKCNTQFKEYRDVNEKLLQAIFGGPFCKKCRAGETLTNCTSCEKEVVNPIYFGDEPYHPSCLPWSVE